ncbi:MAG: bicyclomycin resistance protein [Burkholderiales bacterium PBB5]|nr:MAG: bicyclomycin resistance protein [Burkholderiales bacterium PBB5]
MTPPLPAHLLPAVPVDPAGPASPARRRLGALALASTGLAALPAGLVQAAGVAADEAGRKVLKLAFTKAETSFDPAKIVDLYSRNVTSHIFEALYQYDHLARPAKIKPLTADGMPEVSADFKVWTVKIKPGIFFADDEAFKGRPGLVGGRRELVAEDFVYSTKRFADPVNKSPVVSGVLELGYVGLAALRDDAVKNKKPFDYDKPIEGLQAVDRYTLRVVLDQPRPRFIESMAGSDLSGAVAREVVEFYGDKVDAHPVGTGPFKLKSWRRSSEIVLVRNPQFREMLYDAEPAPGDAAGQAILARMKGRKLPMVDEVRISIIEESQPMWLSFLNGQIDALATNAGRVPPDFLAQAMPGGKIAPNLAKRGIQGLRNQNADSGLAVFNMEDPVVGGYTPEKVALRRAISLAYDVSIEINQIRRGGIPAQSPLVPHTTGYNASFKSEMGDYDPARAKALLDTYGYLDRDGDGFRELPDGKPLTIEMATQTDQLTRKYDELWRKNLNAVGIRIVFKPAQWPENLKAMRAGKIQFWMLGSSAASPDGQPALSRLYGPESGSQNLSRFKNAEFDGLYKRMQVMPDGPERLKLFDEAKRISVAYMPYRYTAHRQEADLLQPWVVGYRRPTFWNEWWHLVDIDLSKKPTT